MLAGLIRSPNYYDPLVHPVKARIRRNDVLDRLAELGWVPQERIDKAKATPLGLARRRRQAEAPAAAVLRALHHRARSSPTPTASSTRSARPRRRAGGASTKAG